MLLTLLACAEPPGVDRVDPPAVAWRDRPERGNVLARSFDVTGDRGGAVTCTARDDPEEVHAVRTGPDRTVTLYGLLADTDYDCLLEVGRAEEERSFRTGPLPDWLPHWTMTVEGDAGGDYTLFNHGTDRRDDRQPKLLIVDPEGRLRWYLPVDGQPGDLHASWLGDDRILFGGGYEVPPTVIDLAGHTLLEAPPLLDGRAYHHHVEPLASGEVATLTRAENTDGTFTWSGVEIQILDPELQAPVWTWNSQRAVDEGWLPVPGRNDPDPYHANWLQVLGDQVHLNLRPLSMLARIDRTSGDLVWRLGQGGDFTLVDETGAPDDPTNWWYFPHSPTIEGDRVLVYDNGSARPGPGPRQSRAAEFEIDEAAMTARLVWEYTEEGWYEGIWGDIDRLPDGNVLITRASCGACIDDPATTQLVEVDPTTNEVVWRLVMDLAEDAGYRAARVDGCELFANRRYCPD